MDEATKLLIGTLSGFAIAFLAEPVKIYFENRSKLQHLKTGLYKELLFNYIICTSAGDYPDRVYSADAVEQLSSVMDDCYKNALKNDMHLFYQLADANSISLLEGYVIPRIKNTARNLLKHSKKPKVPQELKNLSETYIVTVLNLFTRNYSSKQLLRSITSSSVYREMTNMPKFQETDKLEKAKTNTSHSE